MLHAPYTNPKKSIEIEEEIQRPLVEPWNIADKEKVTVLVVDIQPIYFEQVQEQFPAFESEVRKFL